MQEIIEATERMLRDHPHPALRLSELHELVAERFDRTLEPIRLRSMLEEYPQLFRVLDPWRGPWRTAPGSPAEIRSIDPWIVAVTDPGGGNTPTGPAVMRLRESVRWLSLDVDARSTRAVSRWSAIVIAERAARPAIQRQAA